MPDAGNSPALMGDGGVGVVIGTGADPGSPNKFGGQVDPQASPEIVYPADGVVLPPNMNSLEIHFVPKAGQTLFELSFVAPSTTYTVYMGCTPLNGGCVYATDASFWTNLVQFARGTAPISYTLRAVNGGAPNKVGVSASQTMVFGEQKISGGIYYWNSGGTIQRYDFGFPASPAKTYLDGPQAGALTCVGCHVLSRDGARLAVGKDIPAPAAYTVFEVANKQPLMIQNQPASGASNFFSFSPDDNYLLQSDGVSIGMRSLLDGSMLVPVVAFPGTMPDWAPDGLHLVYAKPAQPPPFNFSTPGVDSASLVTVHFNGTDWDSSTTIVPFNGANNYYPAYSPTGEWVLFNRSASNNNSFSNAKADADAGTVPDGELWVVGSSGGAPVRLDKASDPGALSWPKWAPVEHDYFAGKILWLTFSSDRAYGLRTAKGDQTQIWMVGFDPARAAQGLDPSLPGFWFPYQDLQSGNHIAQWATKVPRKPCNMDSQCDPGESCKAGHCSPGP